MRFLCLLLLVLLLSAGCAEKVVPAAKKAQYYAEQGEKYLQNEDYEEAIAAWEKVRDSFHSPELNILAELKISEAYYRNEQYPEAAAACELFLKNHPNHPDTPTVFYRLGLSYFMQMLSPDRDQTAAKNAIVTFRNLLKLYPDFAQKADVEQKIALARARMAEHEALIIAFYLRTDKTQAAFKRYEYLRSNYPEYIASDELYFDLGEAYLEAGEKEAATAVFDLLRQHYPDSGYVDEAQQLLQGPS